MEDTMGLLDAAMEDSSFKNFVCEFAMEDFASSDLDSSQLSRLSLPSDLGRSQPVLSLGDTERLSLGLSRRSLPDRHFSGRSSATKEQILELREQLSGRLAAAGSGQSPFDRDRPAKQLSRSLAAAAASGQSTFDRDGLTSDQGRFESRSVPLTARATSQSERCIFDSDGPPSDRSHFEVALKNVEHSVTSWAQWVHHQLDDVRADVRSQMEQSREISSAAVAELRRDFGVHDELGQQITKVQQESGQFKASLADVGWELADLRERLQLQEAPEKTGSENAPQPTAASATVEFIKVTQVVSRLESLESSWKELRAETSESEELLQVKESVATLRIDVERESSLVANRLEELEISRKEASFSSSSRPAVESEELAQVKASVDAVRLGLERESLRVDAGLTQLEASLKDAVHELSTELHARPLATAELPTRPQFVGSKLACAGAEELREVTSLASKLEDRLTDLEEFRDVTSLMSKLEEFRDTRLRMAELEERVASFKGDGVTGELGERVAGFEALRTADAFAARSVEGAPSDFLAETRCVDVLARSCPHVLARSRTILIADGDLMASVESLQHQMSELRCEVKERIVEV